MLGSDDLLDAVPHLGVIPGEQAEELLERPWSKTDLQCNGFDTLAVEVRELPPHVDGQVLPRTSVDETISEPGDEPVQFRHQLRQAFSIHASSSRSQRVIASFVDSAEVEQVSLAL
jgi:hypothetical protein